MTLRRDAAAPMTADLTLSARFRAGESVDASGGSPTRVTNPREKV